MVARPVIEYALLAAIFGLYPIIICVSSYMFYKHRHKPFFVHRNPLMTIAFCASLVLSIYTSPLPIVLDVILNGSHMMSDANFIWGTIVNECILLFFARSVFILMVRIKHMEVTKKWRRLLQNECAQKSWIVKHYRRLINAKYQLVVILSLLVACNVLGLFIYLGTGDRELATSPGYFLLFFVFAVVLVSLCVVGRFRDFWFIRIEIWCELGILALLFTPMFIAAMAGVTQEEFGFIRTLGIAVVYPILHGFVILFPIWVNRQIQAEDVGAAGTRNDVNDLSYVCDLIEDYNEYERLMEHLTKELCLENLLFVTEMLQFRDWLSERGLMERYQLRPVFIAKFVVLPSQVPVSSIFDPTAGAAHRSQSLIEIGRMNSASRSVPNILRTASSSDDGGPSPKSRSPGNDESGYAEICNYCQIYVALYDKYLDETSSLQLNISHLQQLSLYHRYAVILTELSKDEPFKECDASVEAAADVSEIWNCLLETTNEIVPMLRESLARCPRV